MTDTCFPLFASQQDGYYYTGKAPPTGNKHGSGTVHPYDVYPCKPSREGEPAFFAIIVITDSQFAKLCRAMNKPELASDNRFLDTGARYRNKDELSRIVLEWTSRHTNHELASLSKLHG